MNRFSRLFACLDFVFFVFNSPLEGIQSFAIGPEGGIGRDPKPSA